MKLVTLAFVALNFVWWGVWETQESGTKARFRGLSVVDSKVAWASGSQGTCVKTMDGGKTWKRLTIPGTESLDFRDIEAFDEKTAILLSIGAGELSRIYATTDGGETWKLQHTNRDANGFLDALAFWNSREGLALGDPVDGRFVILRTIDGGLNWSKIPEAGMPLAMAGEGAFAASGTCLVTQGRDNAWFGTGGGKKSRIFRTSDQGKTWTVTETPIRAGSASTGVFSISFRDAEHGLAVGGDYKSVEDSKGNFAISSDGGVTWDPLPQGGPSGFRSAVKWVDRIAGLAIAVGPGGSDFTTNGGITWKKLDGPGFHVVAIGGPTDLGCWAVGEEGRIGKLDPILLRSPSK